MVEYWFMKLVIVGSRPIAVAFTSDIAPVLNKVFLDIQANIECVFPLKWVRDIMVAFLQTHFAGKHSQLNSIIWSV